MDREGIETAQRFYAELDDNNTKQWWQDNKPTYDTQLKAPALDLLAAMSEPLAHLCDAPIKSKLFRPYRDVRFSKDKTPYQTHLHMMWQIEGDAPQNPVFFFGIGIDYVTLGGGMMGFEPAMLKNWRQMLDLDSDRLLATFAGLERNGFGFREPALKRVPPPYGADHIAGPYLRMKGLVASKPVPDAGPLEAALLDGFAQLWPLNAQLISIAEA